MKRYILAILAILVLITTFASFGNGKSKIKTDGVLSVSDIQGDPYAYTGEITINGVVAGAAKWDPKVFAMVETKEAKVCKQTGCAKFYLPVKFEGDIPKEWDEINVTGSFFEGKQLLFKATKVEVLRHLDLGGK